MVTAEQIQQQQTQYALQNYLRLPAALERSIIFVDSDSSVRYAADILHVDITQTKPPENKSKSRDNETTPSSRISEGTITTEEEDTATPHPMIIVGIDVEWRASTRVAEHGASILQVATDSVVFIFDMNALGHRKIQSSKILIGKILSSKHIIKLGWSFDVADIGQLKTSSSGYFKSSVEHVAMVVSLNELVFLEKSLRTESSATSTPSLALADACLQHIGHNMDKGQRMTNWDRRPLTVQQLRYAALDAHCMLAICHNVVHKLQLTKLEEAASNASSMKSDEWSSEFLGIVAHNESIRASLQCASDHYNSQIL